MNIEIIVKNEDGEILGKRISGSWESANENFGKLERKFSNKLNTYGLCLKSHNETPDFEVTVEAVDEKDAIRELREQYGEKLVEFSDEDLLKEIYEQ